MRFDGITAVDGRIHPDRLRAMVAVAGAPVLGVLVGRGIDPRGFRVAGPDDPAPEGDRPVVVVGLKPDGRPVMLAEPDLVFTHKAEIVAANAVLASLHASLERVPHRAADAPGDHAAAAERANAAAALLDPAGLVALNAGLGLPPRAVRPVFSFGGEPSERDLAILPTDHGVSHTACIARLPGPTEAQSTVAVLARDDDLPGGGSTLQVLGLSPAGDWRVAVREFPQPHLSGDPAQEPLAHLAASGRRAADPPERPDVVLWVDRADLDAVVGKVPATTAPASPSRERDLADLRLVAHAVSQPGYAMMRPDGKVHHGADGAAHLASTFGNATHRGLRLDRHRLAQLAEAGGPAVGEAFVRLAGRNLERVAVLDRAVDRGKARSESSRSNGMDL